ncbi:MAG TPA: secretion protein HlyD [Elusimicrobia bacterium]|nr:MAG: hypothetical protein A2278_05235 [Elusimicrobia bacterium RIFOXYA12_FULL_49_49]OGS11860.1 MAG: hypothetical protein A2386_01510 [Elusimicrobia bacterium RIFOXYB1_FULL_48_9]OGS15234.1 MAG: hypothetical protein A2251_06965 [Elusimicrobia bacterium RIFOXYA2_FULL_47_53]OGS25911.1 MAG: hypothetical protein A2339_00840 [Elusimicrobia bacterium RIFOXYB12_FULL_50_12]OGS30285.1 MAG: hypothetical protein A2323_05540 [Elusimicrobia bacterium RIFOXYB2_FULL_46_23]HBU70430.1 secretion protein HlyD [
MKIRVFAGLLAVLALIVSATVVINRNREFLYAGTVEATEVDISSRLAGVIETVNAAEGSKVSKGGLLVKLSAEDLSVAYEAAERDYRRAEKLLSAGSLNQEAFDRIKFKRDDLRVRLGWATIVSPINGTVLTSYHEPGEMVAPGTKLVTLADLENVWAYIYVAQPSLPEVKLGMSIEGYIPESNMAKISGTVVKINDEAEFTPKNVQTRKERTRLVFGVKILFDNKNGDLKPGMTVEMKLPEKK